MPYYPHLLLANPAPPARYTPRSGRDNHHNPPRDSRPAHAQRLRDQLDAAAATPRQRLPRATGNGYFETPALLLSFESDPGFLVRFESLDRQASGLELLSVIATQDGRQRATLRVPFDKVALLLKWIDTYARSSPDAPIPEGKTRKPLDNAKLLESIASIKHATLRELWVDAEADYPAAGVPILWEVWLRPADPDGDPASQDPLATLKEAAAAVGYTVASNALTFVDRTVVLVRGTREQLALSADVLGIVAEVRRAKHLADFFTGLEQADQHRWIASLRPRVQPAPANAPVIGLLDTGLNHGHPLLADLIDPETDLHTHHPSWGTHDADPFHGTSMAGVALYGDLADALAGSGPVVLEHGLQSVKFVNASAPHDPDLYGFVTREAISRLEVNPRPRIYCMAITTDGKDGGRPTSWSAALDDMAFGGAAGPGRLILVSAGNVPRDAWVDYPAVNDLTSIQDPAQAWNVLTIGGMTDKATINQSDNPGWEPLAPPGALSPASTTSVTWTGAPSKPPFKPDIVMEAGNAARNPDDGRPDVLHDLQTLTTNHRFSIGSPPLTTIGETSGATAAAAHLAATLAARYPQFTAETLRGMMVHSARWTEAMYQSCATGQGFAVEPLLRRFGYGKPDPVALMASANNALTLIAQDTMQPFFDDDGALKSHHFKLHRLPWPEAALRALPFSTPVSMRVTLSYFVEPSPGERGWDRRYGYASHGLRFDLIRSLETVEDFTTAINKFERDPDYAPDRPGETGRWELTARHPARGSLHSNIWHGTAQELASRHTIAVVPTLGWWRMRKKAGRFNHSVRYSLIVSISTPDQSVDIYTPVVTLLGIPTPVPIAVDGAP